MFTPPTERRNVYRRSRAFRATVIACAVWSLASAARGADLGRTVAKEAAHNAEQLEALATWCDEKGLSAEAAETREHAKPADPRVIRVLALPEEVGETSKPAEEAAPAVAEWHERYWQLRREQAKRWFQLANQAVRAGHPSLAFELVYKTVAEDPDHEAARRLLGYREFRGKWRTDYEVRKLRSGRIWDDRFGWIRRADRARWERGERPYRGRWIPAEQDARLRRDINSGWDVETEHYSIRTNHSIEEGVRLGQRLEELYDAWKQLFVCYYATPRQIEEMFDRRGPRPKTPRHRIVYFRDRRQYNDALRKSMPGVEQSEGVYIKGMRIAYFFGGDDADETTLLHEATHQLFYESRPVSARAGESANCWIMEGIAVYMETLRKEGNYYVIGGFDVPRMKAARYRLLHDDYYVPLAKLSRYGFPKLQSDPNMRQLYSQMAGLTQFLIYHDGGRYRDALVKYLAAVYSGSQDPALLSRLLGTSYDELDEQYREFIEKAKP